MAEWPDFPSLLKPKPRWPHAFHYGHRPGWKGPRLSRLNLLDRLKLMYRPEYRPRQTDPQLGPLPEFILAPHWHGIRQMTQIRRHHQTVEFWGSEIPEGGYLNIALAWVMTRWCLAGSYRRFERTYCFHFRGRSFLHWKLWQCVFFEALCPQCHNPQQGNINRCICEKNSNFIQLETVDVGSI